MSAHAETPSVDGTESVKAEVAANSRTEGYYIDDEGHKCVVKPDGHYRLDHRGYPRWKRNADGSFTDVVL